MMVIKKSEIRKALQDWRRMEERTCKTNMAAYKSPELTTRFIKRIAFMIGCPKGTEVGERLEKPVLATGDVHYTEPEEEIYREIIVRDRKSVV